MQRSGAPADFGLRKLDEGPTYPCGLIENISQTLLGRFGGNDYGEKSVQDLNEKCINSSVVEIGILSEKLSLEVSRWLISRYTTAST